MPVKRASAPQTGGSLGPRAAALATRKIERAALALAHLHRQLSNVPAPARPPEESEAADEPEEEECPTSSEDKDSEKDEDKAVTEAFNTLARWSPKEGSEGYDKWCFHLQGLLERYDGLLAVSTGVMYFGSLGKSF